MSENEISEKIFYLSEDSIYQILEKFEDNQGVDKSLVYCFIKAFYIHIVKMYLENKQANFNFDTIYQFYKEHLKSYYKANNPNIEDELLDQILNFFDNSFGLIDTIEFSNLEDSYEFRHYTINVFELLRMILEKKSKATIREDIFDNYIRTIISQTDEILEFIKKLK